ncbi:UDP-N-acetylmuramoyl-L-alanyl-D-glutamate--2,6-diaminopimelate ligase [Limnobacter litoralis]|uniref:UDP-N-acetylmuramoyl-L-alanyl-D-glutamate--2,6-diaminopimelate ligase n=1 Tax=Limnobacter litoralis TaxID=481366 RepID=A0ABQ5YQJ3_9BURK|nr:UDP-N-acetylmuramoyl-L-alanyl-D-glutamate--2,6-diaminopimelate ligase [Limnobacter litoralis]GLR26065.1 hypothetical protein GCM10007875_11530 [Limnobacter litoralis]
MSAYLHTASEVLAELHERGFFADCSALVSDSRQLRGSQDVFVAMPGARFDPRTIADSLIHENKAGLVLVEYDEKRVYESAAVVPVLGLQALLGQLAHAYYDKPSERLKIIAVTGTNGKTTVTRWLAQSILWMGGRAAVIGTLGYGEPDALRKHSGLTTPDVLGMHNLLYTLDREGYEWVCLEASSIGLEQGRLAGVHIHCAAFTNLTQDHLDYHQSMQAYADAKMLLASWQGLGCAVSFVQDEHGLNFLSRATAVGAKVASVGRSETDSVYLKSVKPMKAGLLLEFQEGDESFRMSVPVIGAFNAENIAVVYGILRSIGFDTDAIVAALQRVSPAPGRMELISESPCVVVDYAHTPDALGKVLTTLRELVDTRAGQLAVVFGCGGDRDKGKRPQMGRIAAELADKVYVTSDNPRSESPVAIIEAVLEGVPENCLNKVQVEEERGRAIERSIQESADEDVVLLAGKGHEDQQIIGGQVISFSDAQEARRALDKRGER